jgi:hypothetical protein
MAKIKKESHALEHSIMILKGGSQKTRNSVLADFYIPYF